MLVAAAALLSPSDSAQSRAYAKFGPRGETIGLYNLIGDDAAACGTWKVFAGMIAGVRSENRGAEIDYRFTLETEGKLQAFWFALKEDEIPRSDIENLVAKKRGVKVRACADRNGRRRWLAEEIARR